MDDMSSNYTLETFLKMVIEIVERCKTIDEAVESLKKLLDR